MSELKKAIGKLKYLSRYVQMGIRRQRWDGSGSKDITIRVHDGDQFKFKMFGDVTRLLFTREAFLDIKQSFEYKPLEEFKKLLKEGQTVLDVGGNIGLYSLIISKYIGQTGRVYAFEPGEETFDIFQQNMTLNDVSNVECFNVALSDSVGTISLTQPAAVEAENIKGDSLNYIDLDSQGDGGQIPMTTIDNFLAEHQIDRVDIVKIDIEGAEMLFFKGAEKLLSSENKPIIMMECADSLAHRFGYSNFDVLEYLKKFDYEFNQFDFNIWMATPASV